MLKVEFVDLEAQYQSIKNEISQAINSVLESKDFIQGKAVEKFCTEFAKAQGTSYCIGASNGTSAITVALRSLGIGAGDEVITQVNSFFATPEAICEVGAKPIFIDCDPDTYSINTQEIEHKISSRTKAIIPVHLYGNPANMDLICSLARKHNLKIIEDCAQAHLAKWNGRGVGGLGDIGTFSFYPGKNLGAYGDAGALTTNDPHLAQNLRMQVNHGRIEKYKHEFLAGNFRMDGIQAAVLSVKLKHLPVWTQKRQQIAKIFDEFFSSKGIKTMRVLPPAECVYHLYVIEVTNRNAIAEKLKSLGVATGIHYPIPLHLQPALSHLGGREGEFPAAERAATRLLSIPIYPELSEAQIELIKKAF